MTHTPLTARHAARRSIVARAAILLLTAALVAVAGCGTDRATEPGTDPNPNPNPKTDPAGMPPGVRQLINIDRAELPAMLYSGPASDTQGRTYDWVTIVVTRGSMEFVSAERFHHGLGELCIGS